LKLCFWDLKYQRKGSHSRHRIFFFISSGSILFLKIVFTLTHMCIHCVGNLLPSSCPPSTSRQNLFCLLFSNFVEEKTYEIIRKTVFLLVGTKNCLTERCLVLLPCTCVLQPTLVRLYQTSSLLPSVLCQFKITIFTHLQWVHQPHSRFRFPSFSLFRQLSGWPMSSNTTAFVLGL
jgi:hypothetical protein